VETNWTRTHGATGSSPSKVNFFLSCSRHVVILHYTKNSCNKVLYFPKILNHTSLYGLIASGANVDPTSQFLRPPCWYYRSEKIEKYDFRVAPNGIMSIPNFIQIFPAVLQLNHADRQTGPVLHAFISCTSCKEHIKITTADVWVEFIKTAFFPFLRKLSSETEVCTGPALGPRPGLGAQIIFGSGLGSNDSNQRFFSTFRDFSGHSFFFLQRKIYSLLHSSYALDTVRLRKQIPPT
jgi:hypothetical protein